MSILEALGPFWITGIVLNVSLTALAIWWVLRQMRTREGAEQAAPPRAEE